MAEFPQSEKYCYLIENSKCLALYNVNEKLHRIVEISHLEQCLSQLGIQTSTYGFDKLDGVISCIESFIHNNLKENIILIFNCHGGNDNFNKWMILDVYPKKWAEYFMNVECLR
jgi:hypothetical protein